MDVGILAYVVQNGDAAAEFAFKALRTLSEMHVARLICWESSIASEFATEEVASTVNKRFRISIFDISWTCV